jgi:dienelactone hydrolase
MIRPDAPPSHPTAGLGTAAGRPSRLALLLVLLLSSAGAALPGGETGPWDVPSLQQRPAADWGAVDGLVQQVTYAGEPWQGKPTRVFGYFAKPEGKGPFPGVVLVHGGGGKAFREWAEHWAKRGYAALAMDLAGHGPDGRLPDGGPDQGDEVKFRDFGGNHGYPVTDMWTYQAVAAVIRGHSLLLDRPEVDAQRTALTGISWGGYLTCITAGLDHRFKAAVPVYGCGFLHEDSYWVEPWFAKMDEARRERWVRAFDPSRYLGEASCPMLFVNGTNDFAYPLDSYRRSYALVRSPKNLSVRINLPHGHIWTMLEVDTFIDAVLAGGKPLPDFAAPEAVGGRLVARLASTVAVAKVELCCTTDTGRWQKRAWKTLPGELAGGVASAVLPAERPLTCFLLATDERGLCVSTTHVELAP